MAAPLSPSTLPEETDVLHVLPVRAALPQIRVETLIGSQVNYEIKKINNDILLQDNDILLKIFKIEFILTQK